MIKIDAKIVADSVNAQGDRITSYILTYPRSIHAEVMTHRMFSRNAASSRAIPFSKMVKAVKENTFTPLAWQKIHPGMQGTEYFKEPVELKYNVVTWLWARKEAVKYARELDAIGVTKQICNRLLEPFQMYTSLVTATEYDNFFELRCPKYYYPAHGTFKSKKDWIAFNKIMLGTSQGGVKEPASELEWIELSRSGAEIHIQALAEAMWDARNESVPKKLNAGEWHIPFGDEINNEELGRVITNNAPIPHKIVDYIKEIIKVATARCARLSYMTFDGEIDYEKDISLHDMLLESKHMSPFEHCAQAMSTEDYETNIRGKIQCVKHTSPSKIVEEMQFDGKGNPIGYMATERGKLLTYKHIIPVENKGWCRNFKGFIQYRALID